MYACMYNINIYIYLLYIYMFVCMHTQFRISISNLCYQGKHTYTHACVYACVYVCTHTLYSAYDIADKHQVQTQKYAPNYRVPLLKTPMEGCEYECMNMNVCVCVCIMMCVSARM